jgi:hypothetical protein
MYSLYTPRKILSFFYPRKQSRIEEGEESSEEESAINFQVDTYYYYKFPDGAITFRWKHITINLQVETYCHNFQVEHTAIISGWKHITINLQVETYCHNFQVEHTAIISGWKHTTINLQEEAYCYKFPSGNLLP